MIKDNIEQIRWRIDGLCAKVGRNPKEITLVAVTKNRPVEQIEEAIDAGITDIGENKVQEALLKFGLRSTVYGLRSSINFHMVGHLQTNKVKDAVRIFDLIHSVDSLHLAEEINKQAGKINKIQDVLLEIKTSPEATKFGILPEDVIEIFNSVGSGRDRSLHNIKVRGLMTIAPLVDEPEKARPYFRMLRELRDKLGRERSRPFPTLSILSMGMTDDFEVAIEEGATMVRIGRAIFE
ncbi:MAG: YggS family pyridoxal phosphate-dependent enzyme [Candidatus Omnitrophota bacterium]